MEDLHEACGREGCPEQHLHDWEGWQVRLVGSSLPGRYNGFGIPEKLSRCHVMTVCCQSWAKRRETVLPAAYITDDVHVHSSVPTSINGKPVKNKKNRDKGA